MDPLHGAMIASCQEPTALGTSGTPVEPGPSWARCSILIMTSEGCRALSGGTSRHYVRHTDSFNDVGSAAILRRPKPRIATVALCTAVQLCAACSRIATG